MSLKFEEEEEEEDKDVVDLAKSIPSNHFGNNETILNEISSWLPAGSLNCLNALSNVCRSTYSSMHCSFYYDVQAGNIYLVSNDTQNCGVSHKRQLTNYWGCEYDDLFDYFYLSRAINGGVLSKEIILNDLSNLHNYHVGRLNQLQPLKTDVDFSLENEKTDILTNNELTGELCLSVFGEINNVIKKIQENKPKLLAPDAFDEDMIDEKCTQTVALLLLGFILNVKPIKDMLIQLMRNNEFVWRILNGNFTINDATSFYKGFGITFTDGQFDDMIDNNINGFPLFFTLSCSGGDYSIYQILFEAGSQHKLLGYQNRNSPKKDATYFINARRQSAALYGLVLDLYTVNLHSLLINSFKQKNDMLLYLEDKTIFDIISKLFDKGIKYQRKHELSSVFNINNIDGLNELFSETQDPTYYLKLMKQLLLNRVFMKMYKQILLNKDYNVEVYNMFFKLYSLKENLSEYVRVNKLDNGKMEENLEKHRLFGKCIQIFTMLCSLYCDNYCEKYLDGLHNHFDLNDCEIFADILKYLSMFMYIRYGKNSEIPVFHAGIRLAFRETHNPTINENGSGIASQLLDYAKVLN